jgi:tetratricopeptide (TPR) repeat protein
MYLQQNEKALADFTQAINLDSTFAMAYGNRGSVYIQLQQYEKALVDLNQAIKLDDKLAFAYANRSIVYADLEKNYDLALTDINRAIKLDNQLAHSYMVRGFIYSLTGEFNKAITDLEKAAQLYLQQSNQAGYQKVQTIINMVRGKMNGNVKQSSKQSSKDPVEQLIERAISRLFALDDLKQKKYHDAMIRFTTIIENYDNPSVLDYLGRGEAYFELKEYEKAIADYTQAIEIDPHDPTYYYIRGSLYQKFKAYQMAIADFTQAIKIDNKFAPAYYQRGVVYGLQGEFQKALTDAEKAAELYRQEGNEAEYQQVQQFISFIKQEMSK